MQTPIIELLRAAKKKRCLPTRAGADPQGGSPSYLVDVVSQSRRGHGNLLMHLICAQITRTL